MCNNILVGLYVLKLQIPRIVKHHNIDDKYIGNTIIMFAELVRSEFKYNITCEINRLRPKNM